MQDLKDEKLKALGLYEEKEQIEEKKECLPMKKLLGEVGLNAGER